MADQYIAMGSCHAAMHHWQVGANKNQAMRNGLTPLMAACLQGHEEAGRGKAYQNFIDVVKTLWQKGLHSCFTWMVDFWGFRFQRKKWLVKKSRSPRLWFLWAVLIISLMWCYFAVTTTCQVVKVLCQNGVTMETSMREEPSLSGILEIVGSACNMVLELHGRCQLADNGTMWFANFWNCHSGLGFGICCP